MKRVRIVAIIFLVAVALCSVFASIVAPAPYAYQFREDPGAGPSRQHVLGTDDLGRDRFSRLLYGTRVSLLLAPAAALIASLLALIIGGLSGFAGGWTERIVMSASDIFLSLPWLFLLLTVRAVLPLNTSPVLSVIITFALLGCLGWAGAARMICADARSIRESEFVLLARASGSSGLRLLWRQVLPNLRPIALAQFWISIPVFIITEANLGMLGLGISEPLPSWGSLLRELQSYSAITGQRSQFVPLLVFVLVVASFHVVLQKEELAA